MFSLPSTVRIFVHSQPTAMRKSFDGLAAIVSNAFSKDVFAGDDFVQKKRGRAKEKGTGVISLFPGLELVGRVAGGWSPVERLSRFSRPLLRDRTGVHAPRKSGQRQGPARSAFDSRVDPNWPFWELAKPRASGDRPSGPSPTPKVSQGCQLQTGSPNARGPDFARRTGRLPKRGGYPQSESF